MKGRGYMFRECINKETGIMSLCNYDESDNRKVIAVDVDGVLYDLTMALNKTSPLLNMLPLCDDILYDYSYSVYPEWVRKVIFECFNTDTAGVWDRPDCFYKNAFDFLKSIVSVIDTKKYKVVIHTMVPNVEGAGFRYRYLNSALNTKGMGSDIFVCVDVAEKQVMPNCVAIIDDYLGNIVKSKAPIKLVPSHSYNVVKPFTSYNIEDVIDVAVTRAVEDGVATYWVGSSYYSLFNAFVTLLQEYEKGTELDYTAIEYIPVEENKNFYVPRVKP